MFLKTSLGLYHNRNFLVPPPRNLDFPPPKKFYPNFSAVEALMSKRYSWVKLRPLHEGAQLSQKMALEWKSHLKPKVPRPATNPAVARRLIEGTLGVRSNVSKEQRKKEDEELKLARGKGLDGLDFGPIPLPRLWQILESRGQQSIA